MARTIKGPLWGTDVMKFEVGKGEEDVELGEVGGSKKRKHPKKKAGQDQLKTADDKTGAARAVTSRSAAMEDIGAARR